MSAYRRFPSDVSLQAVSVLSPSVVPSLDEEATVQYLPVKVCHKLLENFRTWLPEELQVVPAARPASQFTRQLFESNSLLYR